MTIINDTHDEEHQGSSTPGDLSVTDEPGFVSVDLLDREACFRGAHVAAVPDETDPQRVALDIYLTIHGNVAVYDGMRRTLQVHELRAFVAKYTDAPFAWVVDSVLAALPRPVEYLDI